MMLARMHHRLLPQSHAASSTRSLIRVGLGQRVRSRSLHAIADFCVVPLGAPGGASVGPEVAAVCRLLKTFRGGALTTNTHAYGTNIEGELSDVLAALEACHVHLHDDGVPRVSTTVKLGTRVDKAQTMADKLQSVDTHNRLADQQAHDAASLGALSLDASTRMRQAFAEFDADGDGFITAAELRSVMTRGGKLQGEGEGEASEEVEAMIREADTDGDGRINYQEFVTMVFDAET